MLTSSYFFPGRYSFSHQSPPGDGHRRVGVTPSYSTGERLGQLYLEKEEDVDQAIALLKRSFALAAKRNLKRKK
jgi:hypothetical protein